MFLQQDSKEYVIFFDLRVLLRNAASPLSSLISKPLQVILLQPSTSDLHHADYTGHLPWFAGFASPDAGSREGTELRNSSKSHSLLADI